MIMQDPSEGRVRRQMCIIARTVDDVYSAKLLNKIDVK